MTCLALDPATKTGWAITPELSGVWDLSIRKDESAGMKLLRLEAKLNEISASVSSPLTLVIYEAARHAAQKMQGSLVHQAKLQAVIERWCTIKGIEYKGYSPSEIKKWATGKGNCDKDAMIAAACERWPGIKILSSDHADALHLLSLAQRDFAFAF